ncbi:MULTISPECIES: tetratricopeptide repeat protein [Achromobacter]|uniref:Tetratricopeptide repeat protein n=1 Tax=Achromobacter spanius TaxID=217203 RepID=A0ABY8GZZ1_9BURK|nr:MULTISPECIES: tetratricopeptide repeat protein [Achromobacter]WAI85995.1 tetratricopeptide repeat protein [Achromobacter spanius]WEX96076.1 tetratricopeptide repeat protein [Achromobacter sp. SS2-2022]WFP10205.1 tetratricopeptide repeat protein [Achromobacter spanius]
MAGVINSKARVLRWALVAATAAAGAGLTGCKTNSAESAWQLIQQQQQEQALARQKEEEGDAKGRPKEPEMMLSLISEAQRQERYFASLAYIDAYQQRFGNDARVSVLRAEALRQTGQMVLSEQAYRALLGTDQAADGWHGLGLIAGSRGQFDQAADDFARAAKLSPMDARILGDLGYARLRAGDPAGARVPLGQAAELAPDNGKVLANLAVLLLVEGEPVRAQRLMDQAKLTDEARNQVLRMASDIRAQRAPMPVPVAADASATRVSSGGGMIMPVMSPLMEGLGNGPIVR